jgi:hypothetical protein
LLGKFQANDVSSLDRVPARNFSDDGSSSAKKLESAWAHIVMLLRNKGQAFQSSRFGLAVELQQVVLG